MGGQIKPNSPGMDKGNQLAKANINEPEAQDQRVNRERHFDETEDKDETIESEFYDTRQQFLNLCQGNHYQFDDLRRAKHTSMMVSGWREKRNDPRGGYEENANPIKPPE